MVATRPRISFAALLVATSLSVVACGESFDFAPWTIPVPQGVRLIGHPAVGADERAAAAPIRLDEELVIGAGADDVEALFGRAAPFLAVASDGRIFVLDRSNHRVQVFGAGGEFLIGLGQRGQGPGEFGQANAIFVAGGDLHVWDVVNRRVTRWSLDGELLESTMTSLWGGMIVPLGGGEMLWRAGERTEQGRDIMFRRVARDSRTIVEFARMRWPERVIDPPLDEIVNTEPDAWWAGTVPPAFAGTTEGDVYVAPFEEYQVFSYGLDGEMRWALQVAFERPPLSQVEIDFHMANHARRFPNRSANQIDWPERQYALADVKVDGHGHLYVFPYLPKGTPEDQPRPVDVFSADGERLYTGTLAGRIFTTAFESYNDPMLHVAWQQARGDLVWGVADTADGEREVVRYRLTESF